jgi:hypothetical protein
MGNYSKALNGYNSVSTQWKETSSS